MSEKKTQRDYVLEYVQRFGSITSWEAYKELGVTQLAARIFELEKRGCVFSRERVNTTNRLGKATHYVIYRLVGGANG